MKKLESSLKNMAVVLTGVSVIAGGLLGYVNEVTKEPIKQIKEDKLSNAIKAVLNAEQVAVAGVDTLDANTIVYTTDKGTAVQSVAGGFGGALKVLVGFNAEGAIQGYSVLEHAETPGLGAKAGEWFQKGAKGDIIGKNPGEKKLAVTKDDGGEIDAITASTITSRAFLEAVNTAYKAFKGQAVDAATGATAQKSETDCNAECKTDSCAQAGCKGECDKADCKKADCKKGECKGECDKADCKKGDCKKTDCKKDGCKKTDCKKADCKKAGCEKKQTNE